MRLLVSVGCVNEKRTKDLYLCHSFLHSGEFLNLFVYYK